MDWMTPMPRSSSQALWGPDERLPSQPAPSGPNTKEILGGQFTQVATSVQDHRGDQAQAFIDVSGSHSPPGAVIAHGVQVPVGKHPLDVFEQSQCLVASQEGVARQDDPAQHQAVEPHHQSVAPGLALIAAEHGGEHGFLSAVRVGRPPAFLPAVAGMSREPVQDLGRVQQSHVPPVPVRLGVTGWPER
ncbi:hypothetical protein [Streptomyces sp. BE133]|uniref:hypothetical protein n=1 Tax=Streptomyces sp. BE133 TaxID=3002523 RepID=UPI002E7710C1|nr:hypothetical protein [Streptomyces sp. BE133]MEE1806961.1 hypothetical protein [Streptomyces sp. BE133]